MGIFDTHTHYDDERFDEDRNEVLHKLTNAGIECIVNSGADLESSKKSIALANQFDFVYAAVGVHPHEVKDLKESDIGVIKNLASEPKVVAIGEIGLDYYYDNSPRDIQREWFIKQLKLAKVLNLPVIIHSRDAAEETFDIIKNNYSEDLTGVIHCYSGSVEMAHEYVKLGFYLGIGGVLTYKNAKKLIEVVKMIDIENLVLETDCPYLAPEPKRGTRNDSTNLVYVIKKLAEIKEISEEEIIRITTKNAKRLFRI